MKLTADATIKKAYKITKSQLSKRRVRSGTGEGLVELEAQIEFLERLFDL